MRTFSVKTAVLKKEMIPEYIKHHDNQPPAITRNLLCKGVVDIELHRYGTLLIMLLTEDLDKVDMSRFDPEAEKKWDALMAPMFERFWEPSEKIYHLANHFVKM